MICASCGTENVSGAKFCMECASPLAAGCPNCGFVNLPGAKFCSECATPIAAGPAAAARPARATTSERAAVSEPTAERRLVSVLFADLVGFTPFAEERDAEDVRETLSRYFDLATETIERYGGTIEKFIGDAVMAVWGAPVAQEDDAERAVRAALDLVDRVRGLGPDIQARAGVLTGEAAVTLGATNQGMVAGDLVNTAARLQSVAPPGSVLVGESTQRVTSGAIVFEEAGEQVLKGKQSPVPAWRALRVVAERGGRNRSETLEAPFVGRDDEMRLLKDLFHATNRERRTRLVSVIGPGGIGKSRLAWEMSKYIDGLSEAVWWHDGRSPAYGEGVTFWALGEMVRSRAGLRESDDEQTTRVRISETVRERISDEQERQVVERALVALLGFESGFDPQQLFSAWRTFFERLADVSPVVMVFEDLHFADSGLLDFIDHLQEWSRHSPITIITLARPELLEKRPDWGAGKRSFSSIYLEPLDDGHMRELLSGLVPGLPEKAVATIVARAEGVPLYAVETVRMLLADGRLAQQDDAYSPVGELDDIAVPDTLTALIAARLDALESTDHALIADAAVLGQSFSVDGLVALSGLPADQLAPRLGGLVRRELLRYESDPRSPEAGQYSFMQALIREVAYNTLSRKDRKARHLAAARFFESLGTDEVAGGLASHYLAAYRLSGEGSEADALATQARIALSGAAERAAALGAHQQAIALLEQALEITTTAAERADLHARAMRSAWEGISSELVLRHAEAALAARREQGDREAIVAATTDLGRALAIRAGDPNRALELLLAAWAEFGDLEQTLAGVQLMVFISASYSALDQHAEALAWSERCITAAERVDDPEGLTGALITRGVILIGSGRPREGQLVLRGGHAMALAAGNWDRERAGRTLLTFHDQWASPAAGLQAAREGLEIARQIASTNYGFQMVGNGVICALRVGEWDWAAALLDEWIDETSTEAGYSEFYFDRALLTAPRGGDPTPDLDRATALRALITDPQFEAYDHWARAWADFCVGRFAEAHRGAVAAVDATSLFMPLAGPLAVRAALWLGDLRLATSAMERLTGAVDRGDAIAMDKVTLAAGIAALEGRTTESLAGYREALRSWRSLELALDEALAVLDMVAFLGVGEPEARAAADWARDTLVRLRAQPFLDRLDAVLASGEKNVKQASTQVRETRSERSPV